MFSDKNDNHRLFCSATLAAMFSGPVVYLFHSFNLWGFCTELEELRMGEKWTRSIFVCHFICSVFFCVIISITTYQKYLVGMGLLVVTNDAVKLGAVVISYWFIIIESYSQRPVQRIFWQFYQQADKNFSFNGKSVLRGYFVKSWLFLVVGGFCYVKNFADLDDIFRGTFFYYFIFSYVCVMTMHEMRIFHYLFFVRLLDHQLNIVEKRMKALASASQDGKITCENLKRVRIHHDLVHDLSDCMNKVFGWSNIATILCLFLRLVVDLNWTYWQSTSHMDVGGESKSLSISVFVSFTNSHLGVIAVWVSLLRTLLLITDVFNATAKCAAKVKDFLDTRSHALMLN